MGLPPLVVIAGATATGKTGLSLALAERLPGAEIVTADSRQVYRGMDVGTAKVTTSDRKRVPHHGLDLVDPDQPFSVAAYARHARDALAGIAAREGTALLVGGTGLYLQAVARGVRLEEEAADPGLRAELERRLDAVGVAGLGDELVARAPGLAARIDLRNPRRVIRALERAILVGDRPPDPPAGYPSPVLWLGLRLPRPVHRERIAARAAGQFAGGLLDEAARLLARYPPETRAFSAMGYREAFRVLSGEWRREDALAETVRRTQGYAKRQGTWFRAEPGIVWLDSTDDPLPEALPLVERFLERPEFAFAQPGG